jgi:hypothetical protein
MLAQLSNYGILVLRFIFDYSWFCWPILVGYGLGAYHGHDVGRVKEYNSWYDQVTPVLKRLECERDALWRSAVSKKQKLNRLKREMGRL